MILHSHSMDEALLATGKLHDDEQYHWALHCSVLSLKAHVEPWCGTEWGVD